MTAIIGRQGLKIRKVHIGVCAVEPEARRASPPASPAEEDGPNDVDPVIVTAVYAASLERALTLKREAGYGLDAVSAEDIARLPAANAAEAMQRAGAKVLHAPVADARTHCLTLADCFGQVAAWSHAHPDHELIVIFVNTKEEPFNNPAIPNPPLYTEADLAGIDADAAKAFGRDHIVAPDDLRGGSPTLRQAATGGRWPFVLW